MPSLSNIPEPTTAHRPEPAQEPPAVVPLGTSADRRSIDRRPMAEAQDDAPEHQADSLVFLLLLLIAGGLLRAVLGLLGPIQAGFGTDALQQLTDRARDIAAGQAADPFPLFDLVAGSALMVGLPGAVVVLFFGLLTLAAVPAAFVVGRTLTGRRAPGILAAGLVAVHPAVLTASISLTATSLALALVMIGLALVCHAAERGTRYTVGGGLLLALAGLAAPLCWLVGLLAAPLAARQAAHHGFAKAALHGGVVLVLALTPVVGYRAAMTGSETGTEPASLPATLFVEFAQPDAPDAAYTPASRWLVNVADPSLAELGEALMLPLGDAGQLTLSGAANPNDARRDPIADALADAWLLMNTALACLAVLSAGVMVMRRRFVEALLLATPIAALAFCTMPAGESLRLPLIGLVGVLSLGLLASRPVQVLDEAALAERQAKRAARLAAKEEKARAREERRSRKQLDTLYAFDQGGTRDARRQQRTGSTDPTAPAAAPAGILSQRIADDPPIPARPI